MLSKEQLLKPKRRQLEVDVEPLGGKVKLQEPSAASFLEIRSLQQQVRDGKKPESELFAAMVAALIVTDEGAPLFSQGEAREFLAAAPLGAVSEIIQHFNTLSGKKPGAEGNSEPSPSAS
jgi:hypothetical protein